MREKRKLKQQNASTKRFRFQKVEQRISNLHSELRGFTKAQSTDEYTFLPFNEQLIRLSELYTSTCIVM